MGSLSYKALYEENGKKVLEINIIPELSVLMRD